MADDKTTIHNTKKNKEKLAQNLRMNLLRRKKIKHKEDQQQNNKRDS